MRLLLPLLAAGCLLAALAIPATARDSGAPPGASHRWLPCEDWVMYHWLPYSERRLVRLLRLEPGELRRWLRNDRVHTIAQLARRRGIEPEELASRLVEPRRAGASEEWLAVLRERALRTITQGHLAQHILFHDFHHPGIALRARSIFGVPALEYRRLRLAGRAPAAIGRAHDRSRRTVARRTFATLRRFARLGVRSGAMPRAQADRLLRQQHAGLSWSLDARIDKPSARRTGRIYRKRTLRPRRQLLCFLFAGRASLGGHPHG
jgi:hypothetical protein